MQTCETPIARVGDNLFVKLEYLQIGGSHKARAAQQVIRDAESSGNLRRDGRHVIIEKTGGNFGLGLAAHGLKRGYKLSLIVRPTFSPFKRYLLTQLGADLIGSAEIAQGASNQEILDLYISSFMGSGYIPFFTDQFNNQSCITAHKAAARQYTQQLLRRGVRLDAPVWLVKCAGSAASLSAYQEVFRETFEIFRLIVVQPEGCDFLRGVFAQHPFDGASVGLIPPFLKNITVDEFVSVPHDRALAGAQELFKRSGTFGGRTTGLVFAAILSLEIPLGTTVAFVAYDAGEPYASDSFASLRHFVC